MNGGIEQFNGREDETATLFVSLSVSLTLRGGGFAPRHLNRWAFLGESTHCDMEENKIFAKLSDDTVILAVLLKTVLAQQSEILTHLKRQSESAPDIHIDIERQTEETAELVHQQFWQMLSPIREAFPESRLDELESILELICP